MNIRPFQTGDEAAQLEIYNAAAAQQTKFKPAILADIQWRTQAKDFDVTNCRSKSCGGLLPGLPAGLASDWHMANNTMPDGDSQEGG